MRRKLILGSVAAGAMLLVLGLALLLRRSDLLYKGQRLNLWMARLPSRILTADGYGEAFPGPAFYTTATLAQANQDLQRVAHEATDARKAVRNLGTRCLPVILCWMQARDPPPAKSWLICWGLRLHLLNPSSLSLRSAETIRGQALTALFELGAAAKPAIPGLMALAHSPDAGVKAAARHALQEIAPEEFHRVRNE